MSDSLDQARDRRAGLRSTIDRVERALARPAHGPAAEWSRDLGEQLTSMSAALDQHIAVTEGRNGLLADILEAAPRLGHLIDQARSDHRSCEPSSTRCCFHCRSTAPGSTRRARR